MRGLEFPRRAVRLAGCLRAALGPAAAAGWAPQQDGRPVTPSAACRASGVARMSADSCAPELLMDCRQGQLVHEAAATPGAALRLLLHSERRFRSSSPGAQHLNGTGATMKAPHRFKGGRDTAVLHEHQQAAAQHGDWQPYGGPAHMGSALPAFHCKHREKREPCTEGSHTCRHHELLKRLGLFFN